MVRERWEEMAIEWVRTAVYVASPSPSGVMRMVGCSCVASGESVLPRDTDLPLGYSIDNRAVGLKSSTTVMLQYFDIAVQLWSGGSPSGMM